MSDGEVIKAEVIKYMKVLLCYPMELVFWYVFPILWVVPFIFQGQALVRGLTSRSFANLTGTDQYIPYILNTYVVSVLYGLGIMVSALTLIFKEGWIISEILVSTISIVTPIAYPPAVLPSMLQRVALFFPTTYGIMGIRHFLVGEILHFTVYDAFLRLIILGIVWTVLDVFVSTLLTKKCEERGLLPNIDIRICVIIDRGV